MDLPNELLIKFRSLLPHNKHIYSAMLCNNRLFYSLRFLPAFDANGVNRYPKIQCHTVRDSVATSQVKELRDYNRNKWLSLGLDNNRMFTGENSCLLHAI